MQDMVHLLNRISFGARPGEIERVQGIGPEKYLEQQLYSERINDTTTDGRLTPIASIHMSQPELIEKYPQPMQLARRPGKQRADNGDRPELRGPVQALYLQGGLRPPQQLLEDLHRQKIIRAVHSDRQLQEVMTDFWFNHFNVFWAKNADKWLTTAYEMNTIRPHVLGKFKDLLAATATSPAMT